MQRITALLMFCLILAGELNGQWQILNEGVKGNLNAIDFVNEKMGWVAGDDGVLLKTEDGGQTWLPLPQDGNQDISIIDFLNNSIGWAVASDWTKDEEAIMKTTDGGQTWQIQKVITDTDIVNNSFGPIYVVDKNIVYALVIGYPDRTKILKTQDGGVSWKDISPNSENRNFNSIRFINSDTGFVAGSYSDTGGYYYGLILKTEDGGMTWTEKINNKLGTIDDLQFINDSTGFYLSGGLLYKTEDAFASWPTSALVDSTTWISLYHVFNNGTIYAIVSEGVMKSTNGGITWEKRVSINWSMDKICFSSPKVGFLIGGGTICRTMDSGDHWETQFLSYPFHDVHFVSKEKGFACGGTYDFHDRDGKIFVTHNGGKNWEINLNNGYVGSCFFVNDSVGYALTTSGYAVTVCGIIKTTDGGKCWQEIFSGSIANDEYEGMDIYFANEANGWVVGQERNLESGARVIIITTTDGGKNWTRNWFKESSNEQQRPYLKKIFFLDENTGWAVGDEGLIVKYTPQEQWQEKTKITDLPLHYVFFIDEYIGFMAGGYLYGDEDCLIFLKTINGGETWNQIQNVPSLIHDIYFSDNRHGWAIGSNRNYTGLILETTDGGEHWAVQVDNLIGPLNALSYRDNYLWAVGDCGLVLRLDLTTAVEDNQNQYLPSACQLFQNYPNPFNAGTVITYQLPVVSEVELSIYNLLGQRVSTLISARQNAGSYKLEWNTAGFASGIYYCRLQAGEFEQMHKMILLK